MLCSSVTLYFFSLQKQLPDTHAKFHILFLFFVAAVFFVSVLSLLSYHLWLVGKNRTTIGQCGSGFKPTAADIPAWSVNVFILHSRGVQSSSFLQRPGQERLLSGLQPKRGAGFWRRSEKLDFSHFLRVSFTEFTSRDTKTTRDEGQTRTECL